MKKLIVPLFFLFHFNAVFAAQSDSCWDVLAFSPAFTTVQLQTALVGAFSEILRSSPENFGRIFREEGAGGDVKLQTKNAQTGVIEALTTESYLASFSKDVEVFTPRKWAGSSRESRLIMINGDVFVEGYYRQHRYFLSKDERINFPTFVSQQPWFEFRSDGPQGPRFIPHVNEGASQRLAQHLFRGKSSIELFRGVKNVQEFDFLMSLKQLQKGQLEPSMQKRLLGVLERFLVSSHPSLEAKKIYAEAHQLLSSEVPASTQQKLYHILISARYKEGEVTSENFFFSNSFALAKKYSKEDPVLKITVTAEMLQKFLQQDRLYIGYEFNYIELLFLERFSLIEELLPLMELIP